MTEKDIDTCAFTVMGSWKKKEGSVCTFGKAVFSQVLGRRIIIAATVYGGRIRQ
jgi:hypothetical protein